MKRRPENTGKWQYPAALLAALLLLWELATYFEWVPGFMLPSPRKVAAAFVSEFPNLLAHSWVTLQEAFLGLGLGIVLSVALAVLMDRFAAIDRSVYPLLVISQTVPVIAIAPLLVLWMGYGIAPKVTLVLLVCFFPMTVGLLGGLRSADRDAIRLLQAMGANRMQILRHVKLPAASDAFFSGLKIAVSYSVVGAVIAEWLGGDAGLGVYMTRVRKAYAFDKMFAVIFLVILISLVLIRLVRELERLTWKGREE